MAAQGDGKFGPEADPRIPPKQKMREVKGQLSNLI